MCNPFIFSFHVKQSWTGRIYGQIRPSHPSPNGIGACPREVFGPEGRGAAPGHKAKYLTKKGRAGYARSILMNNRSSRLIRRAHGVAVHLCNLNPLIWRQGQDNAALWVLCRLDGMDENRKPVDVHVKHIGIHV